MARSLKLLSAICYNRPYSTTSGSKSVFNSFGIELLPDFWNDVLFPNASRRCEETNAARLDERVKLLKTFVGSAVNDSSPAGVNALDQLNYNLERMRNFCPKLEGGNLEEHFVSIATKYSRRYKELLTNFATARAPTMPSSWAFQPGWTKYSVDGEEKQSIQYPDDDALIVDVEVCVREGQHPVLAVAMSPTAWYSWCSDRLCCPRFYRSNKMTKDDMIPLEGCSTDALSRERIIVGHNIGFDRTFFKEQYHLNRSKLRFWDTMSMHIAICGLAGDQRILYMAARKGSRSKAAQEALGNTTVGYQKNIANEIPSYQEMFENTEDWKWLEKTSTNSLLEVHRFHCANSSISLSKQYRDVFVSGLLEDVRSTFQTAVAYCATDVAATFEVFSVLMPQFWQRFPHPVTFMGMLEMGTSYLPTDQNWFHYLRASEKTYTLLQRQVSALLASCATCSAGDLMDKSKYSKDPWFWNQCWKQSKRSRKTFSDKGQEKSAKQIWDESIEANFARNVFAKYPKWYSKLMVRSSPSAEGWDVAVNPPPPSSETLEEVVSVTPQLRIVPSLLKLHWCGYPLHYCKDLGWGYLVPGRVSNLNQFEIRDGCYMIPSDDPNNEGELIAFPLREIEHFVKTSNGKLDTPLVDGHYSLERDEFLAYLLNQGQQLDSTAREKFTEYASKTPGAIQPDEGSDRPKDHNGIGPFNSLVNLPGVWFYKLPHKDRQLDPVANPLGKSMMKHIESGELRSFNPNHLRLIADVHLMSSYWKNNRDRIMGQTAVLFSPGQNELLSAILPKVACAGTVTRRAVEPTWMTVSNPESSRIGSELKGLIKSPKGYTFVGADVDSQELWIAALFGDSFALQIHGCTPFSWMLLNGDRSSGTDLHSVTAKEMGISRSQAKILNYGRLYGAGRSFASRLLQTFQEELNYEQASRLARKLYKRTKGRVTNVYELTDVGLKELFEKRNQFRESLPVIGDRYLDESTLERFLGLTSTSPEKLVYEKRRLWSEGSESDAFNALESVARSREPCTPVLRCRISRALEPKVVSEDFLTSRINWVVQSSAVDYLHLLLVSMHWFIENCKLDARFAISIHDEVRYLVSVEDQLKLAAALQCSNLLTRSYFAQKLNFSSLPKTVAFFSHVEIDEVLRKSVDSACATPSNPFGLIGCYGIANGKSLTIEQTLTTLDQEVKLRNKFISCS